MHVWYTAIKCCQEYDLTPKNVQSIVINSLLLAKSIKIQSNGQDYTFYYLTARLPWNKFRGKNHLLTSTVNNFDDRFAFQNAIWYTSNPQSLDNDMQRLFYSTWPPSFSSHTF